MATITTAIQIQDRMTPAFRSMVTTMNVVLNSFESLQGASSKAVDTASIQTAREELANANMIINEVEQGIRDADNAQKQLNGSMKGGTETAGDLLNKIKQTAIVAGAIKLGKEALEMSDQITLNQARLNLIVDDGGSVAELEDKIRASANRSRASYQTTTDMITKLGMQAGDAFASNDELIAFSEQLNKTFAIAGTDATGIESTMYNLTQALSSGVLRGQDLNAVFSNAQPIVKNIADYLDVPVGKIRDMAAEGQLSAQVVKNAMLSAANATDDRFSEIPMTWGQLWTVTTNNILAALQPFLEVLGAGAQWVADNWETIEPIIVGIAAGIAAAAVAWGIYTVAQWIATGAAQTFFATLLANPFMWIAVVIGVIIALIYKWVQSVGGLKVAWLIVVDKILWGWASLRMGFMMGYDMIMTVIENIKFGWQSMGVALANFTGTMKVAVLLGLQSLVNGAIFIINGFIAALNAIPGVSINFVEQATFGTEAFIAEAAEQQTREAELQAEADSISAARAQRQSDMTNFANQAVSDTLARQDEIALAKAEAAASGADDGFEYDNMVTNIGDIAGNTGAIKDSLEVTEEDLKYLRELAEQEVVNRFTTAEIKIDMTNNNNISGDDDIEGIVGKLTDKLEEEMFAMANGVHK